MWIKELQKRQKVRERDERMDLGENGAIFKLDKVRENKCDLMPYRNQL